ncbi:hypothetical protein [Aquabacterium sp.]|uniref:hypothetical protein n=1 Tax=Aquabacterium sp. TaxID=1872578 RepID=UPI0035B2BB55
MGFLILEPQAARVLEGRTRWACKLVRTDEHQAQESADELWFDAPVTDAGALAPDDAEPFLIASLMLAMQEQRSIRVQGRVSRYLLQNLGEYMAFWSRVAPRLYRSVDIEATTVDDAAPGDMGADVLGTGTAMAAFSGGLDATFLAWRHHRRQVGWRSRDIGFFVMLSGFDIRHDRTGHVDASMASARKTLASIGAELKTLRTNLREVMPVKWDHLHGTSLVACFHFFKAHARTMLVASCEPYDDLAIPWGMSPLCDHLLSSSSLRVIHDGAEFSRSEKAAAVAGWAQGCDHLRVCWQDSVSGGNCLKCEKCLRTMANFVTQGHPVPRSLGGDDRYLGRYITRIKLRTPAQESEWRSILSARFAGPRPMWHRWVPVLLFVGKLRRLFYIAKGQPERAGVTKI